MKLKKFSSVCFKIGLSVCIYFVCRLAFGVVVVKILDLKIFRNYFGYAVKTLFVDFFSYAIPVISTLVLINNDDEFRSEFNLKSLYAKPRNFIKAMGNFPAMYVLGQSASFLTIFAIFIFMKITCRNFNFEEYLKSIDGIGSMKLPSMLILFFNTVIVAPIVEELWLRGIVMNLLKRYGIGFAIITSSVIFGCLHVSPRMLLYTTVLGLALGYIAYATGSIFTSTVLHACFNAVNMIDALLIVMKPDKKANYLTDAEKFINVLYNFYGVLLLLLVIIGIIAFLRKIPVIKKYRFSENWSEISTRKKFRIFLLSPTVIAMFVLLVMTNVIL